MEENFTYINDNYIVEEELCTVAGITKNELTDLIQNHLVPDASYVITKIVKITSPLNDEFLSESTEKYFNKSCISLIQKNKNIQDPSDYKEEFKNKFIQNLVNHPDKTFAYGNIFKENIPNAEKLDEAFEEEWEAYCNGIYGICTLNSSEEEIVKKEIAVKKLIHFNTEYSGKTLTKDELDELITLNEEFNEVAHKFAPYQRALSSRGKYLDKILDQNNLNHLVKKY
ncbi:MULTISPECIES: DUF6058 family natural product biosynthesis protein [Chryseobacterium]|uniref:Uncharacterized protein n=1 Tax=Chryseobacterium camelliae TaxID=1265445 RepID=A0ABU0TED4_9FLAO|nr:MULTISPECIES: DUF6058 family natural product biosynthesis protein [Chryseobacterium]MDT3406777.1 hypothetical protein [Pseudacidovorax intermedius]MDQ1095427.1 hypothetical protein [Chryseobacterium camelliae]MDQ1099367.1 hypothetical protein [Chryseobacterium sp. SORGH_AS_1048]MDR6086713.1 hypothetical protein [Chryseobacterium sp. SORGH_AS_0909]MDR6131085.1 hypothetical protein [Chryseobacterium sp. SORGH_AS_1175]